MTFFESDAAFFGLSFFALAFAYGAGQHHGSKALKLRVNKALDQHEKDVVHGHPAGYSKLGLGRIIRDIVS